MENLFSGAGSIFARDRVVPEEASSAQPLKVWLHEFKEGEWASRSLRAVIQFTLKAGLMKPRRGLTLVAGKRKIQGQANFEEFLGCLEKSSLNMIKFNQETWSHVHFCS
jgi:hypothetical protein